VERCDITDKNGLFRTDAHAFALKKAIAFPDGNYKLIFYNPTPNTFNYKYIGSSFQDAVGLKGLIFITHPVRN
jgi:hypothetical protein